MEDGVIVSACRTAIGNRGDPGAAVVASIY